MKEVTQEEFYRVIGPQNVTPTPEGNWPYTSYFRTPMGELRGKVINYLPEGEGLTKKRYLLPE